MIRSVAVLGAGTMGAQIAAHFANTGVPAWLLDLTRDIARQGLERSRALKPDPFFTPETHKLISVGSFDDLAPIGDADWIIEAIVERLDAKRDLLAKVERHRAAGAIVSSNTSGIPIAALAEGRSAQFRRFWLGTHFFNPPRYLRLLEVIPTPHTDPDVVATVSAFAHHRLGKDVVVAKDTPNFIANHIGLFGVLRIFEALASGAYSVEEIDAMTGPAIGRPKSATFRTIDISGLDIVGHVVRNLQERVDDEDMRQAFRLPPLMEEMLQRGWFGEKSGQGFYRRVKSQTGESEILALDPGTMEYRPQQKVKLPELDGARHLENPSDRVRKLFLGNDRVGQFMRQTLGKTLVYTARVAPQIAHNIKDVDRAMKAGFGWASGPFELWDAIGLQAVVDATGEEAPPLVQELLEAGRTRFYPPSDDGADLQLIRSARDQKRLIKQNAGASLLDLGDGVLCVEFHSKMNAIGGDTIQMLMTGVKEAAKNFTALVIGNDAPNFSVGANIMLLLLEAQDENWDEIDLMVRTFQNATMALKYADVPVVVAPAGMALGGGCEIALHADRVQAAAETYLGLVEVGVGLIPGAGGTKEVLLRNLELLPSGAGNDRFPYIQRAFETVAFAKVSTSGPDAKRLGYLRPTDLITMNRDRLLADAKATALARAKDGYQRALPRASIEVGGEAHLSALMLGIHLASRAGRITDHEALIGRKLAYVLSGGNLAHPTTVSERYLLDLEREVFLSLCGERKTQERIQYTLKTGKTLRN